MKNNTGHIKYHIKENSWLAKIAAWKLGAHSVAIVLGKTIHLHGVSRDEFSSDKTWLQHELCHVGQFEQYGFFTFIAKYIWESMLKGYYNNKYEVEARNAEKKD